MDPAALALLGVGLAVGFAAAWLARGGEVRAAEARLDAERARAAERVALLEDARGRLSDAFRALSADALRDASASFLALARTSLERFQDGARSDLDRRQAAIGELLAPVKETLSRLDGQLREAERVRGESQGALVAQLRAVVEAEKELRAEAAGLVRALRTPHVRGRWGELQLRRVVELAGMVDHCDFREQEVAGGEDGRLRPDLVVRLPGGRRVVVDAKAPLSAYLDAMEARDEATRRARLADHARLVREHVAALSRKAYWDQFQPAPELVILFLPGEGFHAAALEQDPSLLELGAEQRVLVATPTTLIALLKAVAYGWRQEGVARNAQAVSDLGRELYKRLSDLGGHFARLGRALSGAVEAYNKTVGTLESRVLPGARRFEGLEASPAGGRLEPLAPVEAVPRPLAAPELGAPADGVRGAGG